MNLLRDLTGLDGYFYVFALESRLLECKEIDSGETV